MLDTYGWSQTLQHQFTDHAARGLLPARVIVQQRGLYRLATQEGEVSAELSGKFLHEALTGDHPERSARSIPGRDSPTEAGGATNAPPLLS